MERGCLAVRVAALRSPKWAPRSCLAEESFLLHIYGRYRTRAWPLAFDAGQVTPRRTGLDRCRRCAWDAPAPSCKRPRRPLALARFGDWLHRRAAKPRGAVAVLPLHNRPDRPHVRPARTGALETGPSDAGSAIWNPGSWPKRASRRNTKGTRQIFVSTSTSPVLASRGWPMSIISAHQPWAAWAARRQRERGQSSSRRRQPLGAAGNGH